MQRNMISESHSTGERPRYAVWEHGSRGSYRYKVDSPEEGAKLINLMAQEQLEDSNIAWNAFGLEELEDGYHEWYDENGDDVDYLCEALAK